MGSAIEEDDFFFGFFSGGGGSGGGGWFVGRRGNVELRDWSAVVSGSVDSGKEELGEEVN